MSVCLVRARGAAGGAAGRAEVSPGDGDGAGVVVLPVLCAHRGSCRDCSPLPATRLCALYVHSLAAADDASASVLAVSAQLGRLGARPGSSRRLLLSSTNMPRGRCMRLPAAADDCGVSTPAASLHRRWVGAQSDCGLL